tara:strand:+ start:1012 stop:1485 length:474 start_codon:yes stop_codon:yes gene_type:complete
MGKFSDKFCGKSPFKRTSIGIGIHQDDPMERTRRYARESVARSMDEKNAKKLTEDYKKALIKKAERKEEKIAKKIAKGSTWGVKRKKRKADRLRKRASEVTEEDVLRMRERNRLTIPVSSSRTRRTPNISSFKNKAEREMYAAQKKTGKLPRQYRGL